MTETTSRTEAYRTKDVLTLAAELEAADAAIDAAITAAVAAAITAADIPGLVAAAVAEL